MGKSRRALTINEQQEIQLRRLDDGDVRDLLWETKRLRETLVQIYDALGVRFEFDPGFARDMARHVRGILDREPAVAEDVSRRHEAKRQAIARAKQAHMPIGWAEFYRVHSFHGPSHPQPDRRGKRKTSRMETIHLKIPRKN